MAILPVDIRDILYTGEHVKKEREQPVRIAVFVDVEADDALLEAFRAALTPATSQARIHVELAKPGEVLVADSMADAVIALAGPGATLIDSLRAARESLVPTVVVTLDTESSAVARRLEHPILDTIVSEDAEQAVHRTGAWLVDHVDSKKLALATNFAFMRRAVAEESVKNTSMQNGLVGGVMFIPGADMPVMTANQAKMIMQIAGVYGEPLGAERIKELAAVVGGGFAFRAIARQFVGLVPGFGWAIKAGIGYSGTWAMGKAAIEYFENGGTVQGLAKHVTAARDRAMEVAARRGKRETVLPAEDYVVSSAETGGVVIDVTPLPAPDASNGEASL